ncbi:MAG: pentapeptide repeat-containing protein, partial [Chroococcales cyanobacterium]
MNEPNANIPSIEQRLEKLEQWQKVASKYINRLKHRLETVESGLQTKVEIKDLASLEGKIEDLESLYDELYDELATESNNLEDAETTSPESTKLQEKELLRQFYERVDQQLAQESLEESESNAEIDNSSVTSESEATEEAETEIETEPNLSGFTDLEFKTERAMFLLNQIYAAEADHELIPVSAEELLEQYKQKQRDFEGIYCAGIDLTEKALTSANFSNSNIRKAKLRKVNINSSNFSNANLSESDLFEASLSSTNLSSADLRRADFRRATLNGTNLEKANLTGANLSEVNLSA